ncbi:group III truncated hemoglobin [Pikeienuella sp. HZG-20]|uniref:group III truncated hemoglobin n=1 Tax=Paludibacillus litoralis TaxID=3133267 RepID=UPI0030EEC454
MTRADIRRLIEPFYKRVRANPRLGPIFEGRIGVTDEEWAEHLATIEAFWSNVMLRERAYQGNPMAVHLSVPEIRGEDFEIWLDLFEETAKEVLPEAKAAAFTILSRRIGASLRMGVEQARGGAVPRLRRA